MLKLTWEEGNLEEPGKLKIVFLVEGTFGDYLSLLSSCQPSWIAAITRNPKNGNYDSYSQYRNLQQKPNPTKFGSIFNFNIMSAILDGNHYENLQQ